MIQRQLEVHDTRDKLSVRVIWVAFALSLLFHAALMWQWHLSPPPDKDAAQTEERGRLRVRLAPAPGAGATTPDSPPAQAARPPPLPPRVAKPVPKPVAPPVIARNRPGPAPASESAPASTSVPAPPVPQAPASSGDFAAMVDARRSARAGAAPAASDSRIPAPPDADSARSDRAIAANLGALRAPALGETPNNSGGVFQIRRLGFAEAEFAFFGWNKAMGRRTPQMIEVRRGDNSDIRVAVVRRMIAIIREHEKGDFQWDSRRLGRSLTLSAHPKDSAGLEEFLLQEFFG